MPFHPHLVAKMIEDVFERYLAARIRTTSSASGAGSIPPDSRSIRTSRSMGVLSALEMACWDIIGKEAGSAGLQAARRARARAPAHLHLHLCPRRAMRTDVYQDPDLAAERAHEYLRQGFTALKFDPAGPYSAFDGRQLSLDGSRALANASAGSCARPSAITRRSAVRHARTDDRGRRDPAGAAPGTLRSAVVRGTGAARMRPEEMAKVARATSIPIAAGERLATKYDFARLLQRGRRGDPADESRPRRRIARSQEDRRHGRSAARADRAASVLRAGGRRRQHPAGHLQPELPDSRGHRALGRLSRGNSESPIRWEEGYVIPPTEPGLGVELNEAVASHSIPTPDKAAAPRDGRSADPSSDAPCQRSRSTTSSSAPALPAACVAEPPDRRAARAAVLLLEAGGSDRRFWVRLPIGYGRTFNDPRVNWMYEAEPDAGLGGARELLAARQGTGRLGLHQRHGLCARTAAATSTTGALWAIPAGAGATCVPHYQAIEARTGGPLAITDVSAAAHPAVPGLHRIVRRSWPASTRPISTARIPRAWVSTRSRPVGGLRESTATAFLRPALRRPQSETAAPCACAARQFLEGGAPWA